MALLPVTAGVGYQCGISKASSRLSIFSARHETALGIALAGEDVSLF
jgi:hypothetical protein